MRSIVYHQHGVLYIIKPQAKYTLARDDIQPQRGWWYAPHVVRRWYTKPAAWINKNRTFVGRQMFCFCWRRRRDLNRLRRPLASRVVSYRLRLLGSAHSRFGSFASQKRYSIVFARSPLPDTRQGSNLSPRKKETDRNGLSLFLAEKERFELL